MLVRKFYCIVLVLYSLQENDSKWEGQYVIVEVFRSGAIKIASLKDDSTQVVNGQRIMHYISGDSYNEDVDIIQVISPENYIKENISEFAEPDLEKVHFW